LQTILFPFVTTSCHRTPFASTLRSLVQSQASLFWGATVCLAVGAGATGAYAYLVGPVLRALFASDNAPEGGFLGPLAGLSRQVAELGPKGLGALVIGTAALKGLAHYGHAMLGARAGQAVLVDLRQRAYAGLLALSPLDALRRARGQLSARFTVDIEAVEGALSGGIVAFIRDILQVLTLVALAVALDPRLALVGLVAFPPAAWLITRLARRLRRRRQQVHGAFGQLAEVVDETAAGLEVIQSFGAQGAMAERFETWSQGLSRRVLLALRLKALGSPINEILAGSALALTLVYARSRIEAGTLSAESFISFFTALLLLYQPVKGLSVAASAVQSGRAALERLQPLVAISDRLSGPPSAEPLAFRSLEMEGLMAGYEDGPNVLRGVTLVIEPGRKIALMGESGCGKTTLLRVLLGFLPLRQGVLKLDGDPLPVDPDALRRLFAFVPQEPFLLRGSIEENVRLGNPRARPEDLRRACDLAGVTQFAKTLPQGLATQVGRDGACLSVGQRQRVCLARALASGAPILLLDEVQAPLDPETEKEINDQLAEIGAHRAILAVTHRPSTAAAMDEIFVMKEGVVETGRGSEEWTLSMGVRHP
jgi:subfamily B ATP-binding cassette protein MsbA